MDLSPGTSGFSCPEWRGRAVYVFFEHAHPTTEATPTWQ